MGLRDMGSRLAGAVLHEGEKLAHEAEHLLGLDDGPYRPPPAFNFSVHLGGTARLLSALTRIDASFQEVSGIGVEWITEEVVEGGENRFVHRLPKQARYSNLVMRRGVVTKSSYFNEWSTQSLGSKLNGPVVPMNLMVSLNGADHKPLVCWSFVNAYPVRIETSSMNSQSNEVMIDTVELSYNYFERTSPQSLMSDAVQATRFVSKLL